MDVPIQAAVRCADGLCGRSIAVIIDPIRRRVTHVVVRTKQTPTADYLVPVEMLAESTAGEIRLRCTQNQLDEMQPFDEIDFLPGEEEYANYAPNDYWLWPFVVPQGGIPAAVEVERVPPGELAIHRGAQVRATDGTVGKVDAFLMDPVDHRITHLVLREGHLWGQKDVTIPVSEIERIEQDTVFLKLDKEDIARLPTVPTNR
jgi:sporulation protein YlmC with PRC-barrel domain